MGPLRVIDWANSDAATRSALFDRGLDDIFNPDLRRDISMLIEDVRDRGDLALCEALARFDDVEVDPDGLRVSDTEWESASVSPEVDRAIDAAITNLRAFNEQQLERSGDWSHEVSPGLVFGEKITPIASAGLFTPSGKASYPSVTYQLAVPAIVAGVPEIAVVVPPVPDGSGEVDPAVLVVCRKLGIRNVFRVNGPAGIAALGFGTETIPKVRKIVGPGSPAVTIAQVEMQRHGVATMMLLGPTESLVIADDTADVLRLAADLLIEAEHGTDSAVVLVTPSAAVVEAVDAELERQLADLPEARAAAARASLGVNGGAVIVDDLNAAVDVANRYAAEHLQVAVAEADTERVVDGIVNAGEILIGQHTPFSAANFVIGCPASLPTSGFAHVSSGITAQAFLKRTAVARADEQALADMAPAITALADHEGFPAHAAAIRRRGL
ncbi:MAG: histidinol dehydrogenase [Ilumatobacteraceae bacterium]